MTDEAEFERAMVKFLFQRIRAGKVKFTPDVPDTIKAIDAVRFDDKGEPLLETVTPPVRAAARLALAADFEEAATASSQALAEVLPNRVDVTDEILADIHSEEDLLPLAIELYREAGALAAVCAGAFVGYSPDDLKLPRGQAACAALLAKMAKYMSACAALADTHRFGEVAVALNRTILESGVNVMYFCSADDFDRAIERFILDGLAPDRDLYDLVKRNIAARGERLPIEGRMLEGIDRRCRESGTSIEKVEARRRDPDFKSRLRAIELEDHYVTLQRIPSAAVHGTWLDLLHHHLLVVEGGFRVRFESSVMDVRILLPVGIWSVRTATTYLDRFLRGVPGVDTLRERLQDVHSRLHRLDEAHELAVQRRPATPRKPTE